MNTKNLQVAQCEIKSEKNKQLTLSTASLLVALASNLLRAATTICLALSKLFLAKI